MKLVRPAAELPPTQLGSIPPPQPEDGEGSDSVRELIETVRSVQRSHLRAEAWTWSLAVFVLLAFLGFALAPLSPWTGRVAVALAWVLPGGVWWAFGRFGVKRRVGDAHRTARWLGERIPGLSLSVLGGAELEDALEKNPAFSPALARAHLRALAAWTRGLDLSTAVDDAPIRRARRALLVVLGLGFLLVTFASGHLARGWAALLPQPDKVTRPGTSPITGEIELTYRYPAYVGMAPRTVPGSNGEITAPLGTEVLLRTRSDRSVSKAGLVVNGQSVPLLVHGSRELSGQLVAKESGTYRFVFFNASGRVWVEGPELPIQVQPDLAPTVTLLTPAQEIEVRPDERVTLKYQAQDDYGLSGLELVYTRRGVEKRIRLSLEDRRRASGQYTWELKALDLEEGERVSYRIEAKDNNGIAGPQRGASRQQILKVYSPLEHQREALAKVDLLWGRLVIQLADRMESPDRLKLKEPLLVAAAAKVDPLGWSLARDLAETGADLRRQRDAPPGLGTALVHVAEGMRERLRDVSEARQDFLRVTRLGRSALGAEQLTHAAQADVEGLERDVLYLESLLQKNKVAALQSLSRKLAQERRQLLASLQELKKTKDPEAKQALLEQVKNLRAHMADLMRQMAELSHEKLDEHLNPDSMAEDLQDYGDQLKRIEDLIQKGKLDEAMAELQKLGMDMNELEQNLERTRGGPPADPQLTEELRSFRKDLDETIRQERKLADQTKALRDRYKEQRRQYLAQRAHKLRDQLLKDVQALAKDYHEMGDSDRMLDETRSELANLEGALKSEDYDLAAEAARRAKRVAQNMAVMGELREQSDVYRDLGALTQANSRASARRLEKNAQKAGEIERQLSQLFPPAGQMMSEEDKETLKQLAEQQRDNEKKTFGLQQKMRQLQQRAPIFGKDAQDQMGAVGAQMNEAQTQLDAQEPSRAHAEQRAALEGLQQFAQRMDQAQKSAGGQGMPMPMADRESGGGPEEGFRDMSRERVEIPDADDSQAPREFRKDLLEAMKQGVPDRYKDQVKHYYEELVK